MRIERIRDDPDYGRTDEIEKGASAKLGRRYTETIVARLAQVAQRMVAWDAPTRAAFVRAESALVSAQVRGWRTANAWAAWRKLFAGELTQYGAYLAAEQFDQIEHLAAQLI